MLLEYISPTVDGNVLPTYITRMVQAGIKAKEKKLMRRKTTGNYFLTNVFDSLSDVNHTQEMLV